MRGRQHHCAAAAEVVAAVGTETGAEGESRALEEQRVEVVAVAAEEAVGAGHDLVHRVVAVGGEARQVEPRDRFAARRIPPEPRPREALERRPGRRGVVDGVARVRFRQRHHP